MMMVKKKKKEEKERDKHDKDKVMLPCTPRPRFSSVGNMVISLEICNCWAVHVSSVYNLVAVKGKLMEYAGTQGLVK